MPNEPVGDIEKKGPEIITKKLTDEQCTALRVLRPAIADKLCPGMEYTVMRGPDRFRLRFTLLDGDTPGFDWQVDTPSACLVFDIGDFGLLFGATAEYSVD